jgi:hypothetical protein
MNGTVRDDDFFFWGVWGTSFVYNRVFEFISALFFSIDFSVD